MSVSQILKDGVHGPERGNVGSLVELEVEDKVSHSLGYVDLPLAFSFINSISQLWLIGDWATVLWVLGQIVEAASERKECETMPVIACYHLRLLYLLKLRKDPIQIIDVINGVIHIHWKRFDALLEKGWREVGAVVHHCNNTSALVKCRLARFKLQLLDAVVLDKPCGLFGIMVVAAGRAPKPRRHR